MTEGSNSLAYRAWQRSKAALGKALSLATVLVGSVVKRIGMGPQHVLLSQAS